MTNQEDRKQQAKDISIVDYLHRMGYSYISGKSTGQYYYYFSMFRNESQPSFLVHKRRNKWKDLGVGGKWEDSISIAMKLEGVGMERAIDSLLGSQAKKFVKSIEPDKPGIEVVEVLPLSAQHLENYVISRGVDLDIARIYCEQVHIIFPNSRFPEKRYSYVGFKNDKEGYELRNGSKMNIAKVSSAPKYFTRIEGIDGEYNLFEGFFDYLRMLTAYKTDKFKNTTVVLNSLVNIQYLHDTLKKNSVNNLFLDNDVPADKCIDVLTEQEIRFTDRRYLFKFAQDINDYYEGKFII